MNGYLTNYNQGGFRSESPQSLSYDYAPSIRSDQGRPAKTSAKSLYEQRKHYARDSASTTSDTSQYHVEGSIIQQDIESAISDSKSGKFKKRPEALRAIAASDSRIPPPPGSPVPLPPGSGTYGDVRHRVSAWSTRMSEYEGYDKRQSGDWAETPEMAEARIDRDVQILNHLLDDIEFFIMKLQKAAEAFSDLSKRRKPKKKKVPGEGVLTLRAKPPPQEEFVDCFQKFKHAFNLLAKLKPHIKNPSASELVHFLFTPLSMMVDATGGADLAQSIRSPLLTKEAIDYLQYLLNAEEKTLWGSLGDSWNKTRTEWSKDQFIAPYIPRFRNGWEPPLLNFTGLPRDHSLNHLAESVVTVAEFQRKQEPRNFPGEYSSLPSYSPSDRDF